VLARFPRLPACWLSRPVGCAAILAKDAGIPAMKKERLLMRLGTTELIVILLVALIIFGPQQLPKLGKTFGKTMKSFQEGMDDADKAPEEKASTEKAAAEKTAPADTAAKTADDGESKVSES
jgi:sec-independent protein translocase protein TatA